MSDQHHNQPQHGFHDDEKRNAHDQFGREHHFEDGQIHPTRTLHYEDSPDSTNGFVKVEKPHDFPSSGHPVVLNATGYPVVLDSEQQQIEITPSDEVAPPTGDDFRRDYAPSPQQFATELASNTTESLEQFLAATQRTAADAGNKGSRYVLLLLLICNWRVKMFYEAITGISSKQVFVLNVTCLIINS